MVVEIMKKQEAKEMSDGGRKLRAASYSIGVNIFLLVIKAIVAAISGSIALLAELAHSFFDLLASFLAYLGIRKADEPADSSHHYGHEKFENLSSFAQTLLITITSILIIYEAANRIIAPRPPEASELGIMVMGATIAIDFFISRYLHRSSKKYESTALEADAYHFTTDLWSAIAVIIGLVFVLMGFPVFDAIAAIVVALLMLWISFRLGRKSLNVLLDMSPANSVIERMDAIISDVPGVRKSHEMKVRQAGSKLFVNIHIHVLPSMTVKRGHEIAHEVKKRLQKEFPNVKEVTVHIEPDMPRGEEEI
jgi:cation diffusion facilitator family transporter